MQQVIKKHAQKIRFALVGGLNTVLDFVLLFIFVGIGIPQILANYFSTGISMIVSFFMNKKFAFKNTSDKNKRQFILFIGITIVGLWVLQPIIIMTIDYLLSPYIENDKIVLFIAKVLATGASLIWNYLLYSKIVFKNNHSGSIKE